MNKKFKALISLILAVAMCAIFCMSAMATVTGSSYPLTETKTGSLGSMSIRNTSKITASNGTVTTYGSTAACYKKAVGTYKYREIISGVISTSSSKTADTTNSTTATVSFSVPNSAYYQSWTLVGNHTVTNNGTLTQTTNVQKQL